MRSVRHLPISMLLVGALAVTGCSSSPTDSSTTASTAGSGTTTEAGSSAKTAQMDQDVDRALATLYDKVPGSENLARKAKGILVFPNIVKGAAGIGGEFGRGALRVNDRTVGYYQTLSASFGFQLGGSARSIVFMFMTDQALRDFENSSGWEVGGNASATLITTGANLNVDSTTLRQPVLAFVYGNAGLMYDASVQGTKVTKIEL